MDWPLKVEDFYKLTRPITPEEQEQMKQIAIDLAERSRPIHYIQDDENPVCMGCGARVDVYGVCATCGRVMKEPR